MEELKKYMCQPLEKIINLQDLNEIKEKGNGFYLIPKETKNKGNIYEGIAIVNFLSNEIKEGIISIFDKYGDLYTSKIYETFISSPKLKTSDRYFDASTSDNFDIDNITAYTMFRPIKKGTTKNIPSEFKNDKGYFLQFGFYDGEYNYIQIIFSSDKQNKSEILKRTIIGDFKTQWEKVSIGGGSDVDLSNYSTKEEVDSKIQTSTEELERKIKELEKKVQANSLPTYPTDNVIYCLRNRDNIDSKHFDKITQDTKTITLVDSKGVYFTRIINKEQIVQIIKLKGE